MGLDIPTADQINRIAELKASRDILEHCKDIVNSEYLRNEHRWCRAGWAVETRAGVEGG
jgi:hypothetical protein